MVIQFTKDTIQESSQPIIIKAFATWCSHCVKMKPIFEQLEKELGKKYIFAELDVDKFPEIAHDINVESIPAFIFIKNKNEKHRVVGEITHNELKEALEKYLG